MRFGALVLVLFGALSGCATTHPGVVQSPDTVLAPLGKAKVVITRNTDSMFMGLQARIDVNGERVAELWRGESYAGVIQPGKVVLSTDAWLAPGNFRAHFKAEADREYIFEVSPRGEQLTTLPFYGVVRVTVEAAIEENTGPFSIYLKETKPLK